ATDALIDAIIDWRDKNETPEAEGAETLYYEDLEPPYKAKNGPIEKLEELLFVKGITADLLEEWTIYLTVYGEGKVNINTASRDILVFLGMNASLVDQIMEFRSGPDMIDGTEDDRNFTDESAIAKTLFEYEPLMPNEVSLLTNLVSQKLLGVQSKVFRIESLGIPYKNINNCYKIVCIVKHEGGDDFEILSWQEFKQ
ncbi:MAG: type II secretion system protein GspK, partial [Chlamydiota bacterium]|nr:type II secretion system protein GspK [Chlamydiota bacterium]